MIITITIRNSKQSHWSKFKDTCDEFKTQIDNNKWVAWKKWSEQVKSVKLGFIVIGFTVERERVPETTTERERRIDFLEKEREKWERVFGGRRRGGFNKN